MVSSIDREAKDCMSNVSVHKFQTLPVDPADHAFVEI